METTMDDDRYNLTLRRSKVWHGKFLGVQKGTWVGLGWSVHKKERITARSKSSRSGSSWKIICTEINRAHPNIAYVGILQYTERVREILD